MEQLLQSAAALEGDMNVLEVDLHLLEEDLQLQTGGLRPVQPGPHLHKEQQLCDAVPSPPPPPHPRPVAAGTG